MTSNKNQIEWLLEIVNALVTGRFTGSIEIQFKQGGISAITKPKEKAITYSQIKRAMSS